MKVIDDSENIVIFFKQLRYQYVAADTKNMAERERPIQSLFNVNDRRWLNRK